MVLDHQGHRLIYYQDAELPAFQYPFAPVDSMPVESSSTKSQICIKEADVAQTSHSEAPSNES